VTDDARLTRQQISDAVDSLGWRLVEDAVYTHVPVSSLAEAVDVASVAVAAAGADGVGCLAVDIRPDRVVLRLVSTDVAAVTGRDVRIAHELSRALAARGMPTVPDDESVSLQVMTIAIDALDIAAVRPFWKAITGYTDEPGPLNAALVDPIGRGPLIWFQQMDAPRPQRNRIHLDIAVPHRAARARIDAALAAGGTLLTDAEAPAFWVLADPEGNEACICTWQGRD
jgi:4a-hydroxytetrahydrobiopterin dehydratase